VKIQTCEYFLPLTALTGLHSQEIRRSFKIMSGETVLKAMKLLWGFQLPTHLKYLLFYMHVSCIENSVIHWQRFTNFDEQLRVHLLFVRSYELLKFVRVSFVCARVIVPTVPSCVCGSFTVASNVLTDQSISFILIIFVMCIFN
jgi:hypothetical protein